MQLVVAGVPIRIRPAFFIVAALLGAHRSDPALLAIWVAASFVSVVLHELGHAFSGRAFHLTPSIELNQRGGVTSYAPAEKELAAWKDVAITLAGPGVGLLLGGAIYAVTRAYDPERLGVRGAVFVSDLLWCNIGWSAVNLLPILPLDGGLVAKSILRLIRPDRAETRARLLSLAAAGAAGAYALWVGWGLGALYAGWLAAPNVQALVRSRRERVDREGLGSTEAALVRGNTEGAAREARKLFDRTDEDRAVLFELIRATWSPTLEGRLADALFQAGDFGASAAVYVDLFELGAGPDAAYNAACAFSRMARINDGIEWLLRAEEAGYEDLAHLVGDTDLDPLRVHLRYPEVVRRLEQKRKPATATPSEQEIATDTEGR